MASHHFVWYCMLWWQISPKSSSVHELQFLHLGNTDGSDVTWPHPKVTQGKLDDSSQQWPRQCSEHLTNFRCLTLSSQCSPQLCYNKKPRLKVSFSHAVLFTQHNHPGYIFSCPFLQMKKSIVIIFFDPPLHVSRLRFKNIETEGRDRPVNQNSAIIMQCDHRQAIPHLWPVTFLTFKMGSKINK